MDVAARCEPRARRLRFLFGQRSAAEPRLYPLLQICAQIVDDSTESWGYIAVDEIVQWAANPAN